MSKKKKPQTEEHKPSSNRMWKTPFWILSLSTDLNLSLFEEFQEDAVVEIFDPEELFSRLEAVSDRIIGRGDIFAHDHVEYADEYIAYGQVALQVKPFHHKSRSFRSQKEYRVIWHPRRIATEHEFLYTTEPLDDIARVILKEDVEKHRENEVIFPDYAIEEYRKHNKPTHWERMQHESLARLFDGLERVTGRSGDGD